MVQRNRNDAILVKINHYEDDGEMTQVSSYYTTALDQTLKMFITARDYEIECWFNEHSMKVDKQYLNMSYCVEEVYIHFGSEDDIPIIEVVI